MPLDFPLRFQPVFRQYLWGGRRLELLGKPIGDGPAYAESWEVVDHGDDQSVVADGPLAGRTLHELVVAHPDELLGPHAPADQFPLLFKYLDACQPLSLQVHPNDEQAARLEPPDRGKTEAWYVVHAEPDAVVYTGLKQGFDRAAFARELQRGTGHLCMHCWSPQAGDCIFVPAGLPHALGAGLLVAEIQQASDTTYRLFDWNRVGPDGAPRALHVEAGLEAIDDRLGPREAVTPQPTADPRIRRLVQCDKFILDRWELGAGEGGSIAVGGDDQFQILSVVDGQAELSWAEGEWPLPLGQTVLLPAAAEGKVGTPLGATVLAMSLPN